ncbi:MAG: hypothetical protein ABFS18_09975 [Thermodesulfobacteriota bacterium]
MKNRQFKMRYAVVGLAVLWVVSAPSPSSATELKFTSDTMVWGYERDKNTKRDILVAPLYEFLQVDYGALSEAGFSLHASGWGRADVGDRDFFADNETGELLYGYLEYTTENYNLSTRLGRQYVFEGPASESIDGIRVQGEISVFSFSGFAGLPVALDEDNGISGDAAYGSTLRYRWHEFNKIGLAYKHVTSDNNRDEESVGLDVFMALPKGVDLTVLSTRNLVSDDWAEHFVEARFDLFEIGFRPYFQLYQYEDYFSVGTNSANPFRYLAETNEELTIFATDLSKVTDSSWEYGAKLKYYDYSNLGDNSQYFSALATWHGEALTQVGAEIGAMAGDKPQNEYFIYRIYAYWAHHFADIKPGFVSADLVFVDYQEEIHNEDSSLFASIGSGWYLLDDSLELKLSVDYSSDPFFSDDWRGMMALTYKFRSEEG